MAEYIEREAIAKLFDSECRGECVVCPHDDRGDCTLMNQIPAADVQPVKHGKWIADGDGYHWTYNCSICGWKDGYPFNERHNFCPNCGARMEDGK